MTSADSVKYTEISSLQDKHTRYFDRSCFLLTSIHGVILVPCRIHSPRFAPPQVPHGSNKHSTHIYNQYQKVYMTTARTNVEAVSQNKQSIDR
jgi:hypothetical protein